MPPNLKQDDHERHRSSSKRRTRTSSHRPKRNNMRSVQSMPSLASTCVNSGDDDDNNNNSNDVDDESRKLHETMRKLKIRRNRRTVVSGVAASAVVLATVGPLGFVLAGVGTGYVVRKLHRGAERRYYRKKKHARKRQMTAKEVGPASAETAEDEEADDDDDDGAFSLYLEGDDLSTVSALTEGAQHDDDDAKAITGGRMARSQSLPIFKTRESSVRSVSILDGEGGASGTSIPSFNRVGTKSSSLFRGAFPSVREDLDEYSDSTGVEF